MSRSMFILSIPLLSWERDRDLFPDRALLRCVEPRLDLPRVRWFFLLFGIVLPSLLDFAMSLRSPVSALRSPAVWLICETGLPAQTFS